jgi:hypothetical protein
MKNIYIYIWVAVELSPRSVDQSTLLGCFNNELSRDIDLKLKVAAPKPVLRTGKGVREKHFSIFAMPGVHAYHYMIWNKR